MSTAPKPWFHGRKPVTDDRLSIGDKVCFIDATKVPVTPESAEGCLKVVGFDDGYTSTGEWWAIVTRCDDAEFVYAGGNQGTTPYVATFFDNLHRCFEEPNVVPVEVAEELDALVQSMRRMGYDVEVQFL